MEASKSRTLTSAFTAHMPQWLCRRLSTFMCVCNAKRRNVRGQGCSYRLPSWENRLSHQFRRTNGLFRSGRGPRTRLSDSKIYVRLLSCWFDYFFTFSRYARPLGFKKLPASKCLLLLSIRTIFVILVIFVDYFAFTSSSPNLIRDFKERLSPKFHDILLKPEDVNRLENWA